MSEQQDILQRLAAPFDPAAISWRVGSVSKDKSKGMALAYIDSRDVQDRLDAVMGADWQDELSVQPNGLVMCRIGLLIDGVWRWRMDSTAALPPTSSEAEDAKAEQAREMAQKGAASDAFKRAGVKWGIGRYLYSLDSPWVRINQWKQIEDDERPRLQALLVRHSASASTPAPATGATGNKQNNPSQARKTGEYPRIEAALRAATNVADLAEVWARAQPALTQMPPGWVQHITAEKDRCKAVLLGDALPQAAE
jgi:hypothetical protein